MGNFLNEITRYLQAQSWQIAVLVVAVAAASFALRNKSAHVRLLFHRKLDFSQVAEISGSGP
jgi:hypothetical protein